MNIPIKSLIKGLKPILKGSNVKLAKSSLKLLKASGADKSALSSAKWGVRGLLAKTWGTRAGLLGATSFGVNKLSDLADRDNEYAMYVSFPNDPIKVGPIKTSMVGGHGMVIAGKGSSTRGSSYGRTYKNSSDFGAAVREPVPNFLAKDPGNPTLQELDDYAKLLVNSKGEKWGKNAHITFVKNANYDKLTKFMKESENGEGYGALPYNLENHNCGVYGVSAINSSMPWYRLIAGRVLNAPAALVGNAVGGLTGAAQGVAAMFDPKSKTTLGSLILHGFTNTQGATGRADMHGLSLPWWNKTAKFSK